MRKVTVDLEDRQAAFLSRKVTELKQGQPGLTREEALSKVVQGLIEYWMFSDREDHEKAGEEAE